MTRAWQRPAIFGAFDGITCCLGVVLSLTHEPRLILPAAAGVAAAEMVGMAAGEWQSNSSNGLAASIVVGATASLGAVLPAIPYAILPAGAARWCSVAVLLAVTAAIAWLRADSRGRRRAFAESFTILAVVAAVVWLVQLLTPGGGA